MSEIWSFFVVNSSDNSRAICKECSTIIVRGKTPKNYSTTPLWNHLQYFHKQLYGSTKKANIKETNSQTSETCDVDVDFISQNLTSLPKQQTLIETFEKHKKWQINDPRAKAIHYRIGEMMALDNQPFNIVEHTGFQRLMKLVAPNYVIPSRRYFSEKIIPNIYDKLACSISELLQDVTSISFTSDIWSDPHANNAYISMSGHFVNVNYERRDILLNVKHFPGRHTGVAISDIFSEMIESWKIPPSKCHLLLRDNAPNISLGAELAQLNSEGCFIHTLQLALNDGIFSQRSVKDIVSIGRNIVKHFSHSPLACSRLNEIQKELGVAEHKLLQDVVTRWNSTFYMLERLYEQRRAIGMFVTDHGGIQNLSNYQWELTENILRVLQPFEELTKRFSSDIVSIGEVIVEIRIILHYLAKIEKSQGVQTMKDVLKTAIESRFVNRAHIYERKNYTFATLLDPRFKKSFFKQQQLDIIKKELMIEILEYNSENHDLSSEDNQESHGSPKNKRLRQDIHDSIRTCFDEIVNEQGIDEYMVGEEDSMKTSNICIRELDKYLTNPLIPRSSNSLLLWKENALSYPNLVGVAIKYLGTPPSSVYSERLFSSAGIVFEEKRNKLLPEKGECLLFIQKNLGLLDFNY